MSYSPYDTVPLSSTTKLKITGDVTFCNGKHTVMDFCFGFSAVIENSYGQTNLLLIVSSLYLGKENHF